MHLVDDEHVPGKAEQAERLVVERQHGHERLVYGADADISEEGFLPVIREPGCTFGRPRLSIGGEGLFVDLRADGLAPEAGELPRTVGQQERGVLAIPV
ncbi:MAG: hypothetical protein BWX50_00854 [Euryarchaeota archaeon ADurb.Bin009]|nr:MAG: hypothetical protein BWX50_00854 [Euryarchaeota archaeon ADurb.Bin009]